MESIETAVFADSGILSRPCQRVLIVEDDSDLRMLVERAVSALDPALTIDWAPGLADAIPLLNEQGEDYRLVLSDYLLDEHGSGFDLKNWCELNFPGLRFAMMSAYPIGPEAIHVLGCRFLPKPFTLGDLRHFVRSALSA